MKKVLIITYYWPPAGGSGVQRWMYFAKFLHEFGIDPFVLTVDESKASYKVIDRTLLEKVKDIKVIRTGTLEPLRTYSRIMSGDARHAIPNSFVGEKPPGLFQKISRFIRGNFFIPDARKGWIPFAVRKAKELIQAENIGTIITTGPPHSTHLAGLRLKKEMGVNWIADFRDPWTEVYYNRWLYRTEIAKKKDLNWEREVLNKCDAVMTVGSSMKKLLEEKVQVNKEKCFVIYNGFDAEIFQKLKPYKDRHFFTISHIGILGESQPITAFLNVLAVFFNQKAEPIDFLKFKIIGNVSPAIIEEIRRTVPGLNLEVITYVSHQEALQHTLDADLLLNSLAETSTSNMIISGKLMEYAASGNPVLCLGDPNGDAASLLKNFRRAEVISRKNEDAIRAFISLVFEEWKKNSPIEMLSPESRIYSRYETTRQLAKRMEEMNLI